jgi:hypothetical protein
MSLLYFFFPSSVDKLNPETGLVYGEAPVLLESDNDENAIMTIFGESKSKHGNLHGFGAEQVILVRDDATRKQIIDLVGKQALVLTIVECKGLEFQVCAYKFIFICVHFAKYFNCKHAVPKCWSILILEILCRMCCCTTFLVRRH